MTDASYRTLAQHLDALPGGFPETESGIELRILKRLFTAEEAGLAVHLSMMPRGASSIARRSGAPLEDVEKLLAGMAKKGLIYRRYKDDVPYYSAAQFVIGIWEYQVNNLDPEFIRDVNEYLPELISTDIWKEVPQLRTIPVTESIPTNQEVMGYERAYSIIEEQSVLAVADCICRKEHRMVGEGCDKPLETCLIFGLAADYYVENGNGRYISTDEAKAILRLAEESSLVLQPGNAQHPSNICCCCGCCCQVLLAFKRDPVPADLVSTPYILEVDLDECLGCGDCIEHCQMDALELDGDCISHIGSRCIGCGLCVPACPSESLQLVRKPLEEQTYVPVTLMETYQNLARVRNSARSEK